MALTHDGAALLPQARALLDQADDLHQRAARLAGAQPVRIGYVSWKPDAPASPAPGQPQLRWDPWVLPSHTQAGRVADGSIDLAICWVQRSDLDTLGLAAHLIGTEELHAVSTGSDPSPVPASGTAILIDADATTWQSWNDWAGEFALDTGAAATHIDDGGVTGQACFDQVRRSRRPVINSPKSRDLALPPDLVRRPVTGPTPWWTWSLVSREGETRPSVLAAIHVLCHAAGEPVPAADAWLPAGDPHRDAVVSQ